MTRPASLVANLMFACRFRAQGTLFAVLAISLAGCNRPATVVTGEVTVKGEPLGSGYVTFFPLAGTKGAQGAAVAQGRFTLTNIPPGNWRAVVAETPEVQVVRSGDGPPVLSIGPPRHAIERETPGNQAVIEIRRGKQAVQIALQ